MPAKILKSKKEIAVLLTLRGIRNPVQARVLARIELAIAEEEFAAEMAEAAKHA